MGCSTFSSPRVQVKVNKTSYLETVWAPLGSLKPSVSIPQQHFRRASEKPPGACNATCLAEEVPGTNQEWDSGIFEIVPVPSSMLATAGHYRHDGYLGSLAPELSLPHRYLAWQESPESVSAMKGFEAAWILLLFLLLLWFYFSCHWHAKY